MKFIQAISIVLGMVLAANASAGWMIYDESTTAINGAINPGPANSATAGPASQSPANVKVWLDNLTGGASGSVGLIDSGDSTPSTITGIVSGYVVLHYGNYQGTDFDLPGGEHNLNIAYVCDSDCGTFTGYDTRGLSGYRVYGVPEPGSLALMTLGLVGLAFSRKRK